MALNGNGSQSQTPPSIRAGMMEREKPRGPDSSLDSSMIQLHVTASPSGSHLFPVQTSVSLGLQKGLDRTR